MNKKKNSSVNTYNARLVSRCRIKKRKLRIVSKKRIQFKTIRVQKIKQVIWIQKNKQVIQLQENRRVIQTHRLVIHRRKNQTGS